MGFSKNTFYKNDDRINLTSDALKNNYSLISKENGFNYNGEELYPKWHIYNKYAATIPMLNSTRDRVKQRTWIQGKINSKYSPEHDEQMSLVTEYDANRNRLLKKDQEYQHIINQLENGKTNTHFLFMIIWMAIIAIVGFSVFVTIVNEEQQQSTIVNVIFILFILYVFYYVMNIIYYYLQGYSNPF